VKRPNGIPGRIGWALRELFLLPLLVYRKLISPALPPRCKYYPSCSTYAVQAVRELGVVRGMIVAGWRLVRCNPWSLGGVDELADRRLFRYRHSAGGDHEHGHGVAA
jgi:putative membrane protein insertion efficiency factor